jgi:hypothetical protein
MSRQVGVDEQEPSFANIDADAYASFIAKAPAYQSCSYNVFGCAYVETQLENNMSHDDKRKTYTSDKRFHITMNIDSKIDSH